MLDILIAVIVLGGLFGVGGLYFTIASVAFGIYVALKYGLKAFEKYAVVDNESETRYTPPTKATYVWYYSILAVIAVLIIVVLV